MIRPEVGSFGAPAEPAMGCAVRAATTHLASLSGTCSPPSDAPASCLHRASSPRPRLGLGQSPGTRTGRHLRFQPSYGTAPLEAAPGRQRQDQAHPPAWEALRSQRRRRPPVARRLAGTGPQREVVPLPSPRTRRSGPLMRLVSPCRHRCCRSHQQAERMTASARRACGAPYRHNRRPLEDLVVPRNGLPAGRERGQRPFERRAYRCCVSDVPQGPGWWQASDGKWYPPQVQPPPPPAPGGRSGCATAAIVVAVGFGALLLIAILCIIAITFLGRSTSEKLSDLGGEIESGTAAEER